MKYAGIAAMESESMGDERDLLGKVYRAALGEAAYLTIWAFH